MHRVIGAVALGSGVLVAIGAAALSHGARAGAGGQPAVSNAGSAVDLAREAEAGIANIRTSRGYELGSARLMAERAGAAFYRLDGSNGVCFGVGPQPAFSQARRLGALVCANRAAAAATRTVDLSTYETRVGSDAVRLLRVAGVAADDVASVGFVDAQGANVLRTPVRDNVYAADDPPGRPVAAVVAYDAAGTPLERHALGPG